MKALWDKKSCQKLTSTAAAELKSQLCNQLSKTAFALMDLQYTVMPLAHWCQ